MNKTRNLDQVYLAVKASFSHLIRKNLYELLFSEKNLANLTYEKKAKWDTGKSKEMISFLSRPARQDKALWAL